MSNKYPFINRLGLVFILLNIYSLIFYIFNGVFFSPNYMDLVAVVWFNLVTLCLFFLPYCFVIFFPAKSEIKKILNQIGEFIYIITCILLFFFISVGIAIYPFLLKHLSLDYILYFIFNKSETNLFSHFIIEYFWIFIIYLSSLIIIFLFQKKHPYSKNKYSIYYQVIRFFSALIIFFIVGRGGFKLKPLGILDASIYASLNNSDLILNSAFTTLKTIHLKGVEEKKYLTRNEEIKWFNPIKIGKPQNILPKNTNVIVVILESFGNSYTGPQNTESYSPFFDSLLTNSLYFKNSVSNGSSSMDALPAILSSLPSWTNESFILSPYIRNKVKGLPYYLKNDGYQCAFFHGANNGSMRFDAFCKKIGFDKYFGKNEYGNPNHDDGIWGIPDHYFLNYSANQINELKEPFLAGIFNISSHHPYKIPDNYKKLVKKGPEDICAAINYSDMALKEFWEKIQHSNWFNNTLFVFCADHTAPSKRKKNLSTKYKFSIPIAFYHPKINLKKISHEKQLQHLDIMPTILDLINCKQSYYAYGSSIFDKNKTPKIVHSQGNFMIFENSNKIIQWNEQKEITSISTSIKQLKAAIQRYNRDLIRNKIHIP